jgi:polar amino acid transport system substrate-binding protein
VNKGNTEVLDLINKGLKAVKASGEYDAIFKKWFPTEE